MSVSQLIWPLLLEGLRTSLALSVLTQRCTQVIFNDDLIRASQLAFAMALLRVCQISGKEAGVESQFFVTPVAARCISLRAPMSLHESWLPHRHSSGWPDVTCYLKLFQNTWCIVDAKYIWTWAHQVVKVQSRVRKSPVVVGHLSFSAYFRCMLKSKKQKKNDISSLNINNAVICLTM